MNTLNDQIKLFLETVFEVGDGERCSTLDVETAYTIWADTLEIPSSERLSPRQVAHRLRERGFKKGLAAHGYGWLGLRPRKIWLHDTDLA